MNFKPTILSNIVLITGCILWWSGLFLRLHMTPGFSYGKLITYAGFSIIFLSILLAKKVNKKVIIKNNKDGNFVERNRVILEWLSMLLIFAIIAFYMLANAGLNDGSAKFEVVEFFVYLAFATFVTFVMLRLLIASFLPKDKR